MTANTINRPLDPATMDALRLEVRGPLVTPGDPSYDRDRRVYNALHDRHPALIVRATGVTDVLATVRFARDHGLTLTVRGGGHSIAGFSTCDDGIVLDLGRMRGIRVDPAGRTVRVEGGCTWGDVDHATHAFGLATTGGLVSTTGIAGLTLGGGMGHLARRLGLACDNLVAADVVTADGSFLTCSEDQHSDLFWALRGAGGNFGVVTSFVYRLHPVDEVVAGPTFFPLVGDVVRGYRDWLRGAPEHLGAVLGLTVAPPVPVLPVDWHGRPVAVVLTCWTGPPSEGDELLRPMREWAPIIGRNVAPVPYPVLNTFFDDLLPWGIHHYWKGHFVRDLPDTAISAHLEHAAKTRCPEAGGFFYPIDGACHRVSPDDTAFAHRDADFIVGLHGSWPDPADTDPHIAWVRAYDEAIRPWSLPGGYGNFDADAARDGVATAVPGQHHERLVTVKRRYDPDNLFRLNQNVPPA